MTVVAVDTRPLRHWLRAADRTHLVICCSEHRDPVRWSGAIARPGVQLAVIRLATCLAQANPAVLLELVAGGASGITVALDGCASREEAASVVARASEFLTALRPDAARNTGGPAIEGATVLPPRRRHGAVWPILDINTVPMSRRALLGRPDGPDLAEPGENPTRRLLSVLRELAGGQDPGTALDGIPTGVPRLTATSCAGSGVCARSCPARALVVTSTVLAEATDQREAMAQFQLAFAPALCTGCGQCLQVCPESALGRSGEHVWSELLAGEPVSLRVGLIRRCARCGGPHGRLGELCAVCAYRAAHPFGSTMPPGWPVTQRPPVADR